MTDAAPRFQFSLADVFVAIVALVYPAVIVSRIDIEALHDPERLAIAVVMGLLVGFLLAIHFRRLWNSQSVWFLPPFLFFSWSLFFTPYVGEWGSYDWYGWRGITFCIPLVFCPVLVGLWNHKLGGKHTVLAGFGGILLGLMLSATFSPSMVTPISAVNEWTAPNQLKALAQAQEIYRRIDYDKDGIDEYSLSLRGLFETNPGAADLMLIDRALADADASLPAPQPKAGYLFRLLTAQTANQAVGTKPWFDGKGNLVGGYAFVAYPARYKRTGRNSFLITPDVIRQKDLGPNTEAIVKAMTTVDPDASWSPSE